MGRPSSVGSPSPNKTVPLASTTQNGVHHWRNEYDAYVPQQDLIDSYMPPFQACVEKGAVTSLMW